jgi:hypothetical protein
VIASISVLIGAHQLAAAITNGGTQACWRGPPLTAVTSQLTRLFTTQLGCVVALSSPQVHCVAKWHCKQVHMANSHSSLQAGCRPQNMQEA